MYFLFFRLFFSLNKIQILNFHFPISLSKKLFLLSVFSYIQEVEVRFLFGAALQYGVNGLCLFFFHFIYFHRIFALFTFIFHRFFYLKKIEMDWINPMELEFYPYSSCFSVDLFSFSLIKRHPNSELGCFFTHKMCFVVLKKGMPKIKRITRETDSMNRKKNYQIKKK